MGNISCKVQEDTMEKANKQTILASYAKKYGTVAAFVIICVFFSCFWIDLYTMS